MSSDFGCLAISLHRPIGVRISPCCQHLRDQEHALLVICLFIAVRKTQQVQRKYITCSIPTDSRCVLLSDASYDVATRGSSVCCQDDRPSRQMRPVQEEVIFTKNYILLGSQYLDLRGELFWSENTLPPPHLTSARVRPWQNLKGKNVFRSVSHSQRA